MASTTYNYGSRPSKGVNREDIGGSRKRKSPRKRLAERYNRDADIAEEMSSLAEMSKFPNVARNLKALAERRRTYAKRAGG